MLPTNSRAWIFVIVACLIGFVIGQWLKARRDRVAREKNAYLNSLRRMALAKTDDDTKKGKRKKAKKRSKDRGLGSGSR